MRLGGARDALLETLATRVREDARFEALLVAGSSASGETDAWSDLDCVVVCAASTWPAVLDERVSFARGAGALLEAFTGEHVGEPRLLICLYGPPLLHADLKFVPVEALARRVDEPRIVVDKHGAAARVIGATRAAYPAPDRDWIEARFWVWIHYAATKLGRGELLETVAMLDFLRGRVLGPMALQAAGAVPNGVRRIETRAPAWARELATTVCEPQANAAGHALHRAVEIYRRLRGPAGPTPVERESVAFLEAVIAGLPAP